MSSTRLNLRCAWKKITSQIELIEDPIYQSPVEISVYMDIYGPLLDSLDGEDYESEVNFFFEVSPMNSSLLVFRNEETKTIFREEAEERNLIPQLVEICEGETRMEKLRRMEMKLHKISTKIPKPLKMPREAGPKERTRSMMVASAKAQLPK
jgi:hypothetical protein